VNHVPWQQKARSLMQEKGVRQQAIAESLHVSKGTVSHWLSGRHKPSLKQLREIAGVLKVSLPELIEDDETFVRDERELEVIRQLRSLDENQKVAAAALIKAVLENIPHKD